VTQLGKSAHRFALTHFPHCSAHRGQARAVYEALERLARRILQCVTPDQTIAEVLGQPETISPAGGDSLSYVELELALEEELSSPELVWRALASCTAEVALTTLLGRWRRYSRWDAETVWLRSLRGVINERVRHSGGCSCAQLGAPSNNQMQRPRPATMEPRR